MNVGAVAEEVIVTGRSELLQTQSADIGNVVDERQVRDLPLLGRRYSNSAFLSPGVVAAPAGITSRGEDTLFNANGNYATWNNYMLDGADNNSFSTNQERSPQVVQPPVDALSEFKVQTRTYSAEFGKAAGEVINASVKQGTNAFSGSFVRFFRDESLNANTWDNIRANRPKGPFNQMIAGGTLGGPIISNKTFFRRLPVVAHRARPVADGDSPDGADASRRPQRADGNMVATNAFVPAGCVDAASKIISQSCFDPVAAKLIGLFPMPNVPGTGFFNNNFISNGILNNDVDQFDIRIDHNPSAGSDHLFARYSFQNTDRHEPPLLDDPVASGDFASDILNRGQSAVVGWSRPARMSQRAARLVQQGSLGRDSPGIRDRLEHAIRHQGRAKGSAILRRAAAHADRALRAAGRPILPPAVPELAGGAAGRRQRVGRRAAMR